MNRRLTSIRQRRDALIEQSESQRRALGSVLRGWREPLGVVAAAGMLLRAALSPPPIVALATALLRRTRYARFTPWIRAAVMTYQYVRIWRRHALVSARSGVIE